MKDWVKVRKGYSKLIWEMDWRQSEQDFSSFFAKFLTILDDILKICKLQPPQTWKIIQINGPKFGENDEKPWSGFGYPIFHYEYKHIFIHIRKLLELDFTECLKHIFKTRITITSVFTGFWLGFRLMNFRFVLVLCLSKILRITRHNNDMNYKVT